MMLMQLVVMVLKLIVVRVLRMVKLVVSSGPVEPVIRLMSELTCLIVSFHLNL